MNDTAHPELPDLGDDRVEAMEATLFARIAEERAAQLRQAEHARVRAVRRGRLWMGGAAAATLVAVAAIIAPTILGALTGTTRAQSAALPAMALETAPPQDAAGDASRLSDTTAGGAAQSGAGTSGADRQIATSASVTLEVADAAAAAQAIATAASAAGGYVESQSTGATATSIVDAVPDSRMMMPAPASSWISVRVPADRLADVVGGLSSVGTVTASQTDRRDVTTETLDLRARVTALESSVARLTELMAQASSTADLIAAETALSARQSELDSLRQQLAWTTSQVEMSTLTVSLAEPAPAVSADPAGFGDGIAAGWNGLVASLNALVIAVGFLLPWLGVAAIVILIVWGVLRLRRRRGATPPADDETD